MSVLDIGLCVSSWERKSFKDKVIKIQISNHNVQSEGKVRSVFENERNAGREEDHNVFLSVDHYVAFCNPFALPLESLRKNLSLFLSAFGSLSVSTNIFILYYLLYLWMTGDLSGCTLCFVYLLLGLAPVPRWPVTEKAVKIMDGWIITFSNQV